MTCGIYCLYFENDDGQFYIGESSNIEKRYKDHCAALVAKRHDNYIIQNKYITMGLPTIEVVEVLENESMLKVREVYWISIYDSFYQGMNLTIGGDGCGFGEDHPSAAYTKEDYVSVLKLLSNTDKSNKAIAEETGVSYNVVVQISIGKTHAYLEKEFPVDYVKMLSKVGTRKPGTITKIPENALKTILELLVYSTMSQKSIAEQTGVQVSVVKSISIGTSHTDLKDKYPIEYSLLRDKQSVTQYTKIKRPKLLSPENEVCEVGNNVSLFCRSKGLDQRAISAVLLGTRSTHKGWKVYNDHN